MNSEIQDIKVRIAESKRRKKSQEFEAKRRERSEIYGGIVKRKLDGYTDERRKRKAVQLKSFLTKSVAVSATFALLCCAGALLFSLMME